jgi:hypothetical protein
MRGELMRKSAGRIFAKGFFISLIFLALLLLIITSSYRLVMHFFGMEDSNAIEIIPPVKEKPTITDPSIDEVSKHLIYCVDEETGEIKKLVLEILDCNNRMLYYITIPIKSQLTLSDSLYQDLILVKPSIPQYFKLSAITGYLPDDEVYEYGVLILEDFLNIQISYYTVVPQSIYDTVFVTGKGQGPDSTYPKEVFSEGFIEYMHTIKTEAQLRDYIKDLYGSIKSNLPLEDKLNYMESYMNTPGKNIVFEVIAGVDSNSEYTINRLMAAKQLKNYIGE